MSRFMRRRPAARPFAAIFLLILIFAASAGSPAATAAPSAEEVRIAQERLHELEREFQLVSEEYNAVREKLSTTQAQISRSELEVRGIERRMATREDDAITLAQELYKSGGTGTLETVLSSQSIADLEARVTYLRSSEQAHTKVFERLAVDRAALNANLSLLEQRRAEAVAAQSRLASLAERIEARVADQRDEIATLNAAIRRAREQQRAEALAQARAEADAAAAAASSVVNGPPAKTSEAPAPAPNARAGTAVDAALSQVGKPYQWGAAGPDSYDCSGLTMWAWARAGVSLPHNSGMQHEATPRVPRSDWQPGDLLFFGSPIHHVAMYIGNGQMVEAPYSGQQVRVVSAYRSDYVGAGRPGS